MTPGKTMVHYIDCECINERQNVKEPEWNKKDRDKICQIDNFSEKTLVLLNSNPEEITRSGRNLGNDRGELRWKLDRKCAKY